MKMLKQSDMHGYQNFSVDHVISNCFAGLFLGMGLGKTVSALTAIDKLMYDSFEIDKVLVISPKRVTSDVWPVEVGKWEHLKHLKVSIVLGTERERKEALKVKADIYCINRENVAWLVGYYQSAFPFDMVVIDELSSFKAADSIRFKALRLIRPKLKRVVGLTGTPAPNGLVDLWSQMYLLDQGERLGKFVTDFKDRFFDYDQYTRKYTPKDDTESNIYSRIGDICISMSAKDYLNLPERIDRDVEIKMPLSLKEKYDEFEKSLVLSLDDIDDISVANAAALSTKLRQFTNGAVYDENKDWHEIHDVKLGVLEEMVEEANGNPVLIFYAFKHDLIRIQKRLKKYKPRTLDKSQDIIDWNLGKIPVLLGHPAGMGHGLNLQAGGSTIIWFGLNWALELYQQAICRLDRQGITKAVINYRLVMKGTIDERVLSSLDDKAEGQDALMNAVKAIIRKYKK